jgi:hypothetical protein
MDETQLNNPLEQPTETFHASPINQTQKSREVETQLNGGRIGVIRIIGPNFVAYCKTMEEFKVFADKHVRDSFNTANERGYAHDDGYKVDIVMLPVRVAFTLKPFTG